MIDWKKINEFGWTAGEKSFSGKQFINTLATVLLEIDGNHKTSDARGCSVLIQLSKFWGYNVPELKKKRKNTAL